MNVVEPPQMQNSQQARLIGLRDAMRSRINTILQNRTPERTDAVSRVKCAKIAELIETKLYRTANTEEEYGDLQTLGTRIESVLKDIQRVCHQQRVA